MRNFNYIFTFISSTNSFFWYTISLKISRGCIKWINIVQSRMSWVRISRSWQYSIKWLVLTRKCFFYTHPMLNRKRKWCKKKKICIYYCYNYIASISRRFVSNKFSGHYNNKFHVIREIQSVQILIVNSKKKKT